jgi:hypothetical protein
MPAMPIVKTSKPSYDRIKGGRWQRTGRDLATARRPAHSMYRPGTYPPPVAGSWEPPKIDSRQADSLWKGSRLRSHATILWETPELPNRAPRP